MLRKIPWPWVGLYATLALFGAASYFKWYSMWGINHLAFLPTGWWVVYWLAVAAITALALVREPTPRLDYAVDRISMWLFERGIWPRAVVTAGFVILFWAFRTPTHFLGDGYTLLGGLGRGETYILKWTEPGAVLLVRLVQSALGEYTRSTALVAFQSISIFAGTIVIYLAFSISRALSANPRARLLIWALIVTSGAIQLFCGYVEFYPALWLLVTAYVVFVLGYLEGRRGMLPAMLTLAASCFLHLQALAFLPGIMFAIWFQRVQQSELKLRRTQVVLLFSATLVALGLYIWLYHTRIDFETIFLPFLAGRPRSLDYAVLSYKHLFDILNAIFLICPMILVLITITARVIRQVPKTAAVKFLLMSFAGTGLFLLLIDPVLGMGRDWDLLSASILPLMLLSLALAGSVFAYSTARILVSIVLVSALVTTSYIAVNAGVFSSEHRYHALLRFYGTKNRSGWTILSNYYREGGDITRRREIADEMGHLFPEDTTLVRAYELIDRENYAVAHELARGLVQFNPYRGDYYQVLAMAQAKLRQYDSAEANYRVAIKLIPYQPMIKNELGQLYLSAKRYPEAQEVFNRILDYDPSLSMVSEGLALAYFYQGKYDSALLVARSLFMARPDSPGGHLICMIVDIQRGNLSSARQHYEAYLVSGRTRSDFDGIRRYYSYLIK